MKLRTACKIFGRTMFGFNAPKSLVLGIRNKKDLPYVNSRHVLCWPRPFGKEEEDHSPDSQFAKALTTIRKHLK